MEEKRLMTSVWPFKEKIPESENGYIVFSAKIYHDWSYRVFKSFEWNLYSEPSDSHWVIKKCRKILEANVKIAMKKLFPKNQLNIFK